MPTKLVFLVKIRQYIFAGCSLIVRDATGRENSPETRFRYVARISSFERCSANLIITLRERKRKRDLCPEPTTHTWTKSRVHTQWKLRRNYGAEDCFRWLLLTHEMHGVFGSSRERRFFVVKERRQREGRKRERSREGGGGENDRAEGLVSAAVWQTIVKAERSLREL